mmetsp:Transcript_20978/g.30426  ORF Transcript_20978/g.30426 Transcript_20978/m.30426 type:complete len:226 (-) Transcript_20978:40-717(-)
MATGVSVRGPFSPRPTTNSRHADHHTYHHMPLSEEPAAAPSPEAAARAGSGSGVGRAQKSRKAGRDRPAKRALVRHLRPPSTSDSTPDKMFPTTQPISIQNTTCSARWLGTRLGASMSRSRVQSPRVLRAMYMTMSLKHSTQNSFLPATAHHRGGHAAGWGQVVDPRAGAGDGATEGSAPGVSASLAWWRCGVWPLLLSLPPPTTGGMAAGALHLEGESVSTGPP